MLEELCSFLCFYEVKSTNLKMMLDPKIVGMGLKVTLGESEAPVHRVCVTSLVCVCARRAAWWTTLSRGCRRLRTTWREPKTSSPNAKSSKRPASG